MGRGQRGYNADLLDARRGGFHSVFGCDFYLNYTSMGIFIQVEDDKVQRWQIRMVRGCEKCLSAVA